MLWFANRRNNITHTYTITNTPSKAKKIITIRNVLGNVIDTFYHDHVKWQTPEIRSGLFNHVKPAGEFEVTERQFNVFEAMIRRIVFNQVLPEEDRKAKFENCLELPLTNNHIEEVI